MTDNAIIQIKNTIITVIFIFFISAAVFFNGSYPVHAAANSKTDGAADEMSIATIDVATVFALHPAMIYYDARLNRFIRPPETPATPDLFLDIVNQRREVFKKNTTAKSGELKKIKEEIEALKEKIKKIKNQTVLDAQPIIEKFDLLIQKTANVQEHKNFLVQRTEALNQLDNKSREEIDNVTKKISSLYDGYEKIQFSILETYYLSAEETEKKFEKITEDIKDAIKIAAKKNGIKAVVNYSLAANGKSPQEENTGDKSIREKTKNNERLEELLKTGPDYSGALTAAKFYESIKLSGEKIKFKNELNKIEQLKNLTAVPFIGGQCKDLTWFAVITLMVKNGIPKEKAEAISEVISEIYQRSDNQ